MNKFPQVYKMLRKKYICFEKKRSTLYNEALRSFMFAMAGIG